MVGISVYLLLWFILGCCPLAEPEEMEETVIGARKTHEILVEIALGQCIEWEFETKSHNIGFGVFWRPKEKVSPDR